LCEALGMSVEKDFLTISCANLSESLELFGGGGAYQGAKEGSELNNFCVEHAGKPSIVLLDEFDKLEAGARDGFYTIFDKGTWVNKRLSRYQSETIDCKNTIWLSFNY
jgi:ATP-dependent Clp protease ATP-binding subunit ClpA